jgi:hypothetical protein
VTKRRSRKYRNSTKPPLLDSGKKDKPEIEDHEDSIKDDLSEDSAKLSANLAQTKINTLWENKDFDKRI